jgi:Protein of unknown function (DUF2568)
VNAVILGARFLLELCLFAALAYVGLQLNLAVAILAPLAAAVVWGLFVSPKARCPPGTIAWVAIQLVLFGAAAAGLVASGSVVLGIVFFVAFAVDLALVLFRHTRDTVT